MPGTARLKHALWILPALLSGLVVLPKAASAPWTALSFMAITAWAAYALMADRLPYSIRQVFWLFVLVFFGITPSVQWSAGLIPWGGSIPTHIWPQANTLILACMGAYSLLMWLSRRWLKPPALRSKQASAAVHPAYTRSVKSWGLGLYLVCGIGIIWMLGPENLWARRPADLSIERFSTTTFLLLDKGLRGGMLCYALVCIWLWRRGALSPGWLTAVLAFCLLCNFPLSVSRFWAATLWLGLLLAFRFRLLERRYTFRLLLLALLIVVYPLLTFSRYGAEEWLRRLSDPRGIWNFAFSWGDFDAYASLCRAMMYVEAYGHTEGRQLLGVLGFYIPRGLWPGKPVGSGALIYKSLGFRFINVSCTLPAEGLINFGPAGSILLTVVFGLWGRLYDGLYWLSRPAGVPGWLQLFYPAALPLSLLLLRGDLLSGFAYLCGFFIAGLIFQLLLRIGMLWFKVR